MGKIYDSLNPETREWLAKQKIFFVATAPLASDGHINCSPKGADSFRVINDREVAYQDLTGSGIETVAHLRENGRIVLMFCAFEGTPRIVSRIPAVLPFRFMNIKENGIPWTNGPGRPSGVPA